MRTANTLHEVTCSCDQCGDVAAVTIPTAGNVKGYCLHHLDAIHTKNMPIRQHKDLTNAEVSLILSLTAKGVKH